MFVPGTDFASRDFHRLIGLGLASALLACMGFLGSSCGGERELEASESDRIVTITPPDSIDFRGSEILSRDALVAIIGCAQASQKQVDFVAPRGQIGGFAVPLMIARDYLYIVSSACSEADSLLTAEITLGADSPAVIRFRDELRKWLSVVDEIAVRVGQNPPGWESDLRTAFFAFDRAQESFVR